jgi:hypothetical protein
MSVVRAWRPPLKRARRDHATRPLPPLSADLPPELVPVARRCRYGRAVRRATRRAPGALRHAVRDAADDAQGEFGVIAEEMPAAPDDPATLPDEQAVAAAERIARLTLEIWATASAP